MENQNLGKAIVKQFQSSLKDNIEDIHAKLMSRYPEAPELWYRFSKFYVRRFIEYLGILFCLFWHLS